jgi:hypothetical protein
VDEKTKASIHVEDKILLAPGIWDIPQLRLNGPDERALNSTLQGPFDHVSMYFKREVLVGNHSWSDWISYEGTAVAVGEE